MKKMVNAYSYYGDGEPIARVRPNIAPDGTPWISERTYKKIAEKSSPGSDCLL